METISKTERLLGHFTAEYNRLHTAYENLFWDFFMQGDGSLEPAYKEAKAARDDFRSNSEHRRQVVAAMDDATSEEKARLLQWLRFFDCYQYPAELGELKKKITDLETAIQLKRSAQKEGYIDPVSKSFIEASEIEMYTLMGTSPDEAIRKACFDAMEQLATVALPEFVERVKLLNEFARGLGFSDFYAYKIYLEEGMTKEELFGIFGDIFEKTKYVFEIAREKEKEKPGLLKPWNNVYFSGGDFAAEEDQYYPLEEMLMRWGRSFAACGVTYRGGRLTLDLLDRKGKYPNGFCHSPILSHRNGSTRIAGATNFTCNTVPGQIGSSESCYATLFHEGAHAAAFVNADQEICLNHEYPPLSTAWAETQSTFFDHIFSSSEWLFRYAKNKNGELYPLELFERIVRRQAWENPHSLHSTMRHCYLERAIYEEPEESLTPERVIELADEGSKIFYGYSETSHIVFNAVHFYEWESACSYHGYALAELAVYQLRQYFLEKYGHIVDNPKIGEEMVLLWKLGSSKSFKEFVIAATGKELSAGPWLKDMCCNADEIIESVCEKLKFLADVPERSGPINLDARIVMVSGKEIICDNSISFEDMAEKYTAWLETQKKSGD